MTKPTDDNDSLLQSWVPSHVHAWVKREAKKKGLSVAAWIRSHFIDIMEKSK